MRLQLLQQHLQLRFRIQFELQIALNSIFRLLHLFFFLAFCIFIFCLREIYFSFTISWIISWNETNYKLKACGLLYFQQICKIFTWAKLPRKTNNNIQHRWCIHSFKLTRSAVSCHVLSVPLLAKLRVVPSIDSLTRSQHRQIKISNRALHFEQFLPGSG